MRTAAYLWRGSPMEASLFARMRGCSKIAGLQYQRIAFRSFQLFFFKLLHAALHLGDSRVSLATLSQQQQPMCSRLESSLAKKKGALISDPYPESRQSSLGRKHSSHLLLVGRDEYTQTLRRQFLEEFFQKEFQVPLLILFGIPGWPSRSHLRVGF